MPTTRKKVIKTVYKDENSEDEGGDFSDSGSEAEIFAGSSSEEEEVESEHSSADEFDQKSKNKIKRKIPPKKAKFAKSLIKKINKQTCKSNENENIDVSPALFSIKDLTEADKLLPPILNLSESESSDDESPKPSNKTNVSSIQPVEKNNDSDGDVNMEYKDVWSNNLQVQDVKEEVSSEEIAKKTFMELEQHKTKIEETKATLQNYSLKIQEQESDVKDLLALGEEVLPRPETSVITKKSKSKKPKDDSDSEMEDWEEVKDSKAIQQGIQLFVEFPDVASKKSKKIDVEMMMRRKINRVKKEYQVYMHKVHVLCWLGHGNYISRVLNEQELMAAALSLVPSKECYPSERVDMKYVEQITTWYKDKLTLNQDKNEDKFKPKAPPLKTILLELIKKRVVTSKKYLVFIFVAMLRALGLQCRIIFNFVTLPLKPPSSELCSLSTKPKTEKTTTGDKAKSTTKAAKSPLSKTSSKIENKDNQPQPKASTSKVKPNKQNIAQVDGNYDSSSSDIEMFVNVYSNYRYENIMQVDGNDDTVTTRKTRSNKRPKATASSNLQEEDVSPPKIHRKAPVSASPTPPAKSVANIQIKNTQKGKRIKNAMKKDDGIATNTKLSSSDVKIPPKNLTRGMKSQLENENNQLQNDNIITETSSNSNTRSRRKKDIPKTDNDSHIIVPTISVTGENKKDVASEYFGDTKPNEKFSRLARKRSQTTNPSTLKSENKEEVKTAIVKTKTRTKSAPGTAVEKSKYFDTDKAKQNTPKNKKAPRKIKEELAEDKQRVSHRDLVKNSRSPKVDVTGDLVNIIKTRIKDAKIESKKGLVKGKIKQESDEDSDYLPVKEPKRHNSDSDDDFKPTKISPKPSVSRRIDRSVLSTPTSEEPVKKNKIDVWCEIFVEELEQWISVDVIKGKIHSTGDLYTNATHPVCYVVGWDNNNYLKDLTRKYVPQYNTVTRKLRAEPQWWDKAIRPYLGPKTARDKEEDEYLDRMQLEAPLPKSIAEYKNHPLYALKRHLLKFEAIYPADAAVLGFVRGEAVYARECVYTCRSRDTWLKEAKVVKLGEKPYKVVKARPKWDKLSNKLITDKPLEVFGPWQVQDYEPPVAENGIVPRNAYGNVELFKDCMLPKGTVHIKLPGLNRVAKKLNIDCAPAMTGFDFNGGWSHPVYDGFVVCKEFEEIVTEAWAKDQEEQERREREKTELRVYGNWKRLIKGLIIRERLKNKYGFEEPKPEPSKGKSKGPRLLTKKK